MKRRPENTSRKIDENCQVIVDTYLVVLDTYILGAFSISKVMG